MSEEQSFEELLNATTFNVRNGAIIEDAEVLTVEPNVAYLNVHTKADGVLKSEEYSNENVDLTTVLKPGDVLEVKVLKVSDTDGVQLTRKRLAAERGNKRLEEAFNSHEILTAKVTQVQKGGLTVLVEGTRVFIPASLVSDSYERDLTKYQDQEIEFIVSEFNPRKRRIIGDRKQILVERKKEAAAALFARIAKDDIVDGVVKNVTDFGAFIDLGGADGLLHISEMSWGRVENPKKVFHVGQEVTVMIKDIKGEKIALTLKFPDKNPWNEVADKYEAGSVIKGRVARMTDFGAFVEILPGVDGLLHVSQISRDHVDKPSDVLSVGQEVEAKIVDFHPEAHKISLSVKQLLNDRAQQGDWAPIEDAIVFEDKTAEAAEAAEEAVEEAAETTEE